MGPKKGKLILFLQHVTMNSICEYMYINHTYLKISGVSNLLEKGQKGEPGRNGTNGFPGLPGPPGKQGFAGKTEIESIVEPLLWGHPFCVRNVTSQEGWPLVQGKKSIHLDLDLHCPVAFPEGLTSQGGLSKGVPLYFFIIKNQSDLNQSSHLSIYIFLAFQN